MTRDEVLAMVMQADKDGEFTSNAKLWDAATYEFVGRIISISSEAGRKAAEQDRVDAERIDFLESMVQQGKVEIAVSLLKTGYEIGHWKKPKETVQVTSGTLRDAIDRARSAK